MMILLSSLKNCGFQCDRLQTSLWVFHSCGFETMGMLKTSLGFQGLFFMYKIHIRISIIALRIRNIYKTYIKVFNTPKIHVIMIFKENLIIQLNIYCYASLAF